ncbi:serine hydroxymethyltransferase [Candidatus Micrarchaeota archaeon]|nr:serine hydroxymethyltransferase [Candidatus Micrarchaeota archaeon]MBU1165405.1 serine hydroxymethyltransferase [Candidatus Micrarchaeota archaeon]MBU1886957.1 serine hydroxymethyltransferase [Candidatus Micrarchaeota archaeon]
MSLKQTDGAIYELIEKEKEYQNNTLRLIASENYTSNAVMEATGSILTNKYAEGYPNKRYYAGNKYVDEIELLAIERAKKLFKVGHANVQSHSGSSANIAAFFAFLEPGDKFMGLDLPHGGHLTHGSHVNFSGKWFNAVHYSVDKETEALDYDDIRKKAIEEKPKLIICGYTAYPLIIDFKEFRSICDETGAVLMTDISHFAGLVAGEAYPSPVQYADIITTTTHKTLRGPRSAMIMCPEENAKTIDKSVFPGTQGGPLEHCIAAKAVCFHEAMQPDFKEYAKQVVMNAKVFADELATKGLRIVTGKTETHLILVDLTQKGVTGKDAQMALEEAGIITNKNTIPFDTKSPFITSGLRFGTAALTTRGMKEDEMKWIADNVVKIIENPNDNEMKVKIRNEVKEICDRFPVYK